MGHLPDQKAPTRGLSRTLVALLRWLASLKLATVLIVVLAVVLAWGTVLDASHGAEQAQWYIYHSSWFMALLALLAVNILAAALVRFPWRWRRAGFVVTHAGLLAILAGAIATLQHGIEGHIAFVPGETQNAISLSDRCQVTVQLFDSRADRAAMRAESFSFRPGPVDWPDGKTLGFEESGDVGLKILKFYRHARVEEDWIADSQEPGTPALRLALLDADGQPVQEDWLVGEQLGGDANADWPRLEIQRAPVASMLEDFLKPPAPETDPQGVLSVHFEGRMLRIPVSKSIGKKFPLGDGKVSLELVAYLPNAKPTGEPGVRFATDGNEPKNPLLELLVHLPGAPQPMRQIAFANRPLMSFDGIHGRVSPVKFWYHHPAVIAEPGIEFLQTPDGKLYCRIGLGAKYEPRGEVHQGDRIPATAKSQVSLVAHLAAARRQVTFFPVELAAGASKGPEPAVLVEVSVGGVTEQAWMRRNDPEYGHQTLRTAEGMVALQFENQHIPLGFSLKLLDFQRGLNPGGMGDASFTSVVQLVDRHQQIDEQREITMNEPLSHGKFTFYQSGFRELSDGRTASTLSVSCDPGLLLKYLGSVMLCVGMGLMFVTYSLRRRPRKDDRQVGDGALPSSTPEESLHAAP